MRYLIAIIFLLCSVVSYGQSIAKDETDKFTKRHIQETTWENLRVNGFDKMLCRIRKVDTSYYLQLRIVQPKVYATAPDDKVYLHLTNDSVVVLNIEQPGLPTLMGGYWLGEFFYPLYADDRKLLLTSPLNDIRVTLTGTNVDYEVKERNSERILDALKLLMK